MSERRDGLGGVVLEKTIDLLKMLLGPGGGGGGLLGGREGV